MRWQFHHNENTIAMNIVRMGVCVCVSAKPFNGKRMSKTDSQLITCSLSLSAWQVEHMQARRQNQNKPKNYSKTEQLSNRIERLCVWNTLNANVQELKCRIFVVLLAFTRARGQKKINGEFDQNQYDYIVEARVEKLCSGKRIFSLCTHAHTWFYHRFLHIYTYASIQQYENGNRTTFQAFIQVHWANYLKCEEIEWKTSLISMQPQQQQKLNYTHTHT